MKTLDALAEALVDKAVLEKQLKTTRQERDAARQDASNIHERWNNTLTSLHLSESETRKAQASLDRIPRWIRWIFSA